MVLQIYHVVLLVLAWSLDKPAILDRLNLILNLNQARGTYQLHWTLTFRVSTSLKIIIEMHSSA